MTARRGKSGEGSPSGDPDSEDSATVGGNLIAAVGEGRLEGLRALRDTLAREIEVGPVGEKAVSQTAALARQLRDTLKEIAELEKLNPKRSVVDDLAAQRKARRSAAKGAAPAKRNSRKQRPGSS